MKSRNQLRLERRAAEYNRKDTIQWRQAHRQGKLRRWARDDSTGGLLHSVLSMLARRKLNVARMKHQARARRGIG